MSLCAVLLLLLWTFVVFMAGSVTGWMAKEDDVKKSQEVTVDKNS